MPDPFVVVGFLIDPLRKGTLWYPFFSYSELTREPRRFCSGLLEISRRASSLMPVMKIHGGALLVSAWYTTSSLHSARGVRHAALWAGLWRRHGECTPELVQFSCPRLRVEAGRAHEGCMIEAEAEMPERSPRSPPNHSLEEVVSLSSVRGKPSLKTRYMPLCKMMLVQMPRVMRSVVEET